MHADSSAQVAEGGFEVCTEQGGSLDPSAWLHRRVHSAARRATDQGTNGNDGIQVFLVAPALPVLSGRMAKLAEID